MFPESKRVQELQELIAGLNQEIRKFQAKAKAYFEHGKQNAQKLDAYFAPILETNHNKLKSLLDNQPTPVVAGWNSKRWVDWNAETSSESEFIRVGGLADKVFSIPAYLPFIGKDKTIIVRSRGKNFEVGATLLQSLVIRTVLMLPHQSRYTLLDPAGHGIAFPMRRYLPQVQENSGDVRRDLDYVISEIQRIIQTYLDASVTSFEKVRQDVRINERYHFVFAADFPNQYDRRAIEALQSIGNTGTKAGVYLFVHYNQDHELPRDMSIDDFKNAFYFDIEEGDRPFSDLKLRLNIDSAPPPDLQTELFKKLKETKAPERRLDWDSLVGIPKTNWWREKSTNIIHTPIGASGGTDKLNLWFGVNDEGIPCAHGMLGAMTGAGKSNLYHVLICGLAVRYSPEELRLYLIDGKNGVEFQPYRYLPHAEVVSLHTSSELSRSVLAELIAEQARRNSIFSETGVNDYVSYRQKGEPRGRMPRILLLVDEYQELFDGDRDGHASETLLDLAQQGRSAGIHMLLASQRFGAAGMLHQGAIFGSMHLRLAMKMAKADIESLIEFGRRGKALISTCDLPGKIVVNDRAGDDGANHAGKVAYLDPDHRDKILQLLMDKAQTLPDENLPQKVIFDGKAQPVLIENPYLMELLRKPTWFTSQEMMNFVREPLEIDYWNPDKHPRVAWLGQEFNVRGHAAIVFHRKASENVLVVGSRDNARYAMLAAILIGLSTNTSPVETQFIIFDGSQRGSQWNEALRTAHESALLPAGFTSRYRSEPAEIEDVITSLNDELDRRRDLRQDMAATPPSIFVIMTELDDIDSLRRTMSSYGAMSNSPLGENLERLYRDGSRFGIHLVLSFSNVRAMAAVIDERREIHNFLHRVALQMSEDDSHTFVKNREASLLQNEGLSPICALYVDLERHTSVRFKPYSIDISDKRQGESFIEQIKIFGRELSQRGGNQ
jgi:S-DNA-T family DNA segregation ATPase FtsK/SpoIIIE